MARVPLIEPPYDVGRNDWNITRAMANAPAAFTAFTKFAAAMGQAREIPRSTREVAILRVGALVGSDYEWGRHVNMALRAGLSEDQIAGVKVGDGSLLNEEERMAMSIAEAVERTTMTDDLWGDASALFSVAQLVELVMYSAMYSLVSRFLVALDVDPDPDIVGFTAR